MINKKVFLLLLAFFLLGFSVTILVRNKPTDKSDRKNPPSHPLVFFDKDTFYAGIEQAKDNGNAFTGQISGSIIPHHLFPGFIIADFFSLLAKQGPKTIILIGPNHLEKGNFKALTSIYGWETSFGVVEPNTEVIDSLLKENLVRIDEEVLSGDQAVAGIMPFIKYYLPNSQVVPILLSGHMSQGEAQSLADSIKDHLDRDTVLIAAVDFSHGLTNKEAQEKDKVSLELMKGFNYGRLYTLNNDYLDSSPSIVALLMTMQALGTTKTELLYHTNSGEIQKNNSIETTSYFSIVYY